MIQNLLLRLSTKMAFQYCTLPKSFWLGVDYWILLSSIEYPHLRNRSQLSEFSHYLFDTSHSYDITYTPSYWILPSLVFQCLFSNVDFVRFLKFLATIFNYDVKIIKNHFHLQIHFISFCVDNSTMCRNSVVFH